MPIKNDKFINYHSDFCLSAPYSLCNYYMLTDKSFEGKILMDFYFSKFVGQTWLLSIISQYAPHKNQTQYSFTSSKQEPMLTIHFNSEAALYRDFSPTVIYFVPFQGLQKKMYIAFRIGSLLYTLR